MLNMETWDKYIEIKEILGAEQLLEAIAQALSTDELANYLQYIARCYDLDALTE